MRKQYYRPDIDGLRALAIIPVVLFHFELFGFSGGYVGVDIFFVISGYLIASIILRDIKANSFSLLHFWQRRVRRIVPILSVVMASTLAVGYHLLLFKDELLDLGQSAFAQSLFLSNVFFLRGHNYFAGSADTFPLLHTWSLSVEEQFYVIFPLLLLLIFAFWKKRLLILTTLLALASFAANIYLVHIVSGETFTLPFLPNFWDGTLNTTAAFYLTYTRAWELLLGVLLAMLGMTIKNKWLAEVLSAMGIIAILFSIFTYTDATPWPGIAALVPTLGAVALILANTNNQTFTRKILSLPILVWIGLISYSLYLWHWPIYVYANIILNDITIPSAIMLIFVSIALSWISYHLIEQPFRKKFQNVSSKKVIFIGLITLVGLAGIGYSFKYIDVEQRIPLYAQELLGNEYKKFGRFEMCHEIAVNRSYEELLEHGQCVLGDQSPTRPVSFVVWGDSLAGVVLNAVDNVAKRNNVKGMYFSIPNCVGVIDFEEDPYIENCKKIRTVATEYIETNNIKNILLVSRWEKYTGQEFGPLEDETEAGFAKKITEMIETFSGDGRNVYVYMMIPRHEDIVLRDIFYESIEQGVLVDSDPVSLEKYRSVNAFSFGLFENLAIKNNLTLIYPEKILCNDGNLCHAIKNDRLIYHDPIHLNTIGIPLIEPLFEPMVEAL